MGACRDICRQVGRLYCRGHSDADEPIASSIFHGEFEVGEARYQFRTAEIWLNIQEIQFAKPRKTRHVIERYRMDTSMCQHQRLQLGAVPVASAGTSVSRCHFRTASAHASFSVTR